MCVCVYVHETQTVNIICVTLDSLGNCALLLSSKFSSRQFLHFPIFPFIYRIRTYSTYETHKNKMMLNYTVYEVPLLLRRSVHGLIKYC